MLQPYYQNPIAKNGDFADPYVLRWNGRYYLYCTNPDLRCWSSADLVHWVPEGPVIEPNTFSGLVPFAPEVVYSNGTFYMYTSPSGFGHFVLESKRPTGPFCVISENVGHAIDGSVFIDDDGKWYFYWAGDEGIWGCEMPSPTEFGEPVLTGAFLHGWTEGPLVRKQNGVYYMTYTGNHYLSSGYRIQTASSHHPLTGYTDDACNPAVIATGGCATGLGHSSTVLGPNLVSYYMIYHNINRDASRDLDIDRQLWQGSVTQVLGPTTMPQPAPSLPENAFPAQAEVPALAWCFAGNPWHESKEQFYSEEGPFEAVSEMAFGPQFTAEFHLALVGPENGLRGIFLEQSGKACRYAFIFLQQEHCVELQKINAEGVASLKKVALPTSYNFEALHCLRVEQTEESITLWVDDRLQLVADINNGLPARLGYFSDGGQIGCGYTAVTSNTYNKASHEVSIPAGCSFAPVFGRVNGVCKTDGSLLLKSNETAQYTLWVPQAGEYELCLTRQEGISSCLRISLDGRERATAPLQGTLFRISMTLGYGEHTLTITGAPGTVHLTRIVLRPVARGFMPPCSHPELQAGPYGKSLWGEVNAGDYQVQTEMKLEKIGDDGYAGLLLRVTQSAEGGEGADQILGINFFMGYSVCFTGTQCFIARHRYNRQVLATCPCVLEEGRWFTLRALIQGGEIFIYLDALRAPLLTAHDSFPLTHGCYGLLAKEAQAQARNICVTEFK